MPEPVASPALSAREQAGRAFRQIIKGATIPWEELSETRRRLWCENADAVVYAAVRATVADAVDPVARELYREHHEGAGTFTEWTMREWDHGGTQHVNKEPWRNRARKLLGLVESTYRQTGHVAS